MGAPAWLTSIATVSAAALLVACGGEEEPDYGGDMTPATQALSVTANDFTFSPAALAVDGNAAFDLDITNAGDAPHTVTIDELDIDVEVAAGEKQTVSLKAAKSGEFAFYCRLHRDQGMEGVIQVSGPADAVEETPAESTPEDDPYYNY